MRDGEEKFESPHVDSYEVHEASQVWERCWLLASDGWAGVLGAESESGTSCAQSKWGGI